MEEGSLPFGGSDGSGSREESDLGESQTSMGSAPQYGRKAGNNIRENTKLEQTIHNSHAALDDNIIHEHWRDPNNAIIDLILEFPYTPEDKKTDQSGGLSTNESNPAGVAVYPLAPEEKKKFFLDYTRKVKRREHCIADEQCCEEVVGHGFCEKHLGDRREYMGNQHFLNVLGNRCNCYLKTLQEKVDRKEQMTVNENALLASGTHDPRCKTIHRCILNVQRDPRDDDLHLEEKDEAVAAGGPRERRKSIHQHQHEEHRHIVLPAPLETLGEKMNEVLERTSASGFRRMRDVFDVKKPIDSMSCFGRTRRAASNVAEWLGSCLPDIQGALSNCLEDTVELVVDEDDHQKLRILPVTNLRHLLVDTLIEKGFIIKPLFQDEKIVLFISAPLAVLMEQAQGMKIALPLKNQLWSERRPDKSGQPQFSFLHTKSDKVVGSMMCAGLGNTLLEPGRYMQQNNTLENPSKKREYLKEREGSTKLKMKDGKPIPDPKQVGFRYGEIPWDIKGRVVHIRSHAPVLVYGEELYGKDKNDDFKKLAVDGVQDHENESTLEHMLVDDTHLKVEDYHAFKEAAAKKTKQGGKMARKKTMKTHGGLSLVELQNWCKEVLQDGAKDKDLVKDFLRKSQQKEDGIAYLHLETALTLAIKAKHGKYLHDLNQMFDRQVKIGDIEIDDADPTDGDELEDANYKRQFNHFVVQEVRYLMQHDCCRTMTWPTPNLIVGELLQQVLNDLKLNNTSAAIFYHEKNEAEALPASLFWIDPIIPAVLIGPRSARRIDGSIKGYGLTEDEIEERKEKKDGKGKVIKKAEPLGDYPKVRILRPTVKRADPRTTVPFRFESKFKHVLKPGFAHMDKSQNRSDLKADQDTYTQVADGALWTSRRQMFTVEALQRLDLDVEHSRRMLADDRNRAGRYGHNLLFDTNNYKFRDFNAIHSTRTMHVAKKNVKPAAGPGEERALVPANFQWMLSKDVFTDYILPHDEDYVFDKLLITPTVVSLQAEFDHFTLLGVKIMTSEQREAKETAAKGAHFEDDKCDHYENYGHENSGMLDGMECELDRRLNIQALSEEVTALREELRIDDRMRRLEEMLEGQKEYSELCDAKVAASKGDGRMSTTDQARMKELKCKLATKEYSALLEESRAKGLRAGIKWQYCNAEMNARDNAGQNWAVPVGLSNDVLKSRSQVYQTFWGVMSTAGFWPFSDFLWRPTGDLPIPWIRRYFGEHYTFYLVWSQTLNQTMWVPVVAGLAATAFGLQNLFKKGFCGYGKYVNFTESVDESCRDLSLAMVLEEVTNTGATPIFAIVLCLWTAFFLEKWVRREHTWSAYWHTAKGKWLFSNPSRLRPGFRATLKPPGAEMTVPQGYESTYSRTKRLLTSYTLIVTYIIIVIGSVVGVMVIRIQLGLDPQTGERTGAGTEAAAALAADGSGDSYSDDLVQPSALVVKSPADLIVDEAIETFIPSLIQAFFIFIFSIIYGKIAHFLTSLENHRTQQDYNNHYIVKLFLFQVVNYFTGLYYIAFFRQGLNNEANSSYTELFGREELRDTCGEQGDCMGLLSMQVLILVISMPFFKVLKENTVPYLLRKLRMNEPRTWWELEQTLNASPKSTAIRISSDTTVDEFVNKIMMYGIVTMFAVSMPLAPIVFYLSNYLDFLFIGTRRLRNSRRTLALKAHSIGHWNTVLLFINGLAVLTNGFLMIITGETIPEWLAGNTTASLNGTVITDYTSLGEHAEAYSLVLFEHVILIVMFLMHMFIPNMPKSIEFKHYATARTVRRHFKMLKQQNDNTDEASSPGLSKVKKMMPTIYRAAASFATAATRPLSVKTMRRRSSGTRAGSAPTLQVPGGGHGGRVTSQPVRSASEAYRFRDDYEDAWIDVDRDGVITDAEVAAAEASGHLGFGSEMDKDFDTAFKTRERRAPPTSSTQSSAQSFGFDERSSVGSGRSGTTSDGDDSDLNL